MDGWCKNPNIEEVKNEHEVFTLKHLHRYTCTSLVCKLSEDLDFNVALWSLSFCLWCLQQHLECMARPAGLLAAFLCRLTEVDCGTCEGTDCISLLGETRLVTAGTLYLVKEWK